MKTGIKFLQTLLALGLAGILAGLVPAARAATALDTSGKSGLDAAKSGDVATKVKDLLAAAPEADRAQLAKDIIAYLAAKPGVSKDLLTSALTAAIGAVPAGNAGALAGVAASGAPTLAADIAGAAAAAAPKEAVAITTSVIKSAGAESAAAVTKSVIAAAPESRNDVIAAALQAAPDQTVAINQAAKDTTPTKSIEDAKPSNA